MHSTNIYQLAGITLVQMSGGPFTHHELWKSLGEQQYVATFELKADSEAYKRYGPSVVGRIAYTMGDRREMSRAYDPGPVRIDSLQPELATEAKKELKYHGFSLESIRIVSFVPLNRPEERHESGEKKLPNVIEIPYDHDPRADVDRLTQSYLVRKNNDGMELAPFERDQVIGITLGLNDGHIDRRILEHFGHDTATAAESLDVRYYRLQTKQRHGGLTEAEKSSLAEVEELRSIHALIEVLRELKASQLKQDDILKAKVPIAEVMQSVRDFHPSVLLHGKPQVFWDLKAYVHITMRQVRDFQIGQFRERSAFPYKVSDLEQLIEKVLKVVAEEIEQHFKQSPTKLFTRHGSMSTYFNGDYYSFRIEPSGRMSAFCVCRDRHDSQA